MRRQGSAGHIGSRDRGADHYLECVAIVDGLHDISRHIDTYRFNRALRIGQINPSGDAVLMFGGHKARVGLLAFRGSSG